jgi:peptidoglycan/LPS O-acetylase OafA/YrhL
LPFDGFQADDTTMKTAATWLHDKFVGPFLPDKSHLDVLTGIRGWAALWVYLYHVWSLAGHPDFTIVLAGIPLDFTPLVSIGFAGVTIFFVLSGFLLAIPFAQWQSGLRQRPALDRYFLRRVMRVFPAYYVQLAILLLIAAWIPGQPGVDSWGSLLRHLFMLFTPPPLGTLPMNGVWWTLPIEFSFYLVLPLLALLLRPGRWGLLLTGSLLAMYFWRHGVALRMTDAPISQRVVAAYQLPGSMDAFSLGMLSAYLYVNRLRLPLWVLPRKLGRLGLPGLALVLAATYWLPGKRHEYWADNPIFYLWTPALVLGVAALILSGVGGGRVTNRLFTNRFIIYSGLVSYSYYIWHLPVLSWIVTMEWFQGLGSMRFLALLLVSAPLIFLISTLSYVLIEVPGMRYRRGGDHARPR